MVERSCFDVPDAMTCVSPETEASILTSTWRLSWEWRAFGNDVDRSVWLFRVECSWLQPRSSLRSEMASGLARKDGATSDGVISGTEVVGETQVASSDSLETALSSGEVRLCVRRLVGEPVVF